MSLIIRHHPDGKVTVECDGQTAEIWPPSSSSRPPQPIPPPQETSPGSPKVGPRIMFRMSSKFEVAALAMEIFPQSAVATSKKFALTLERIRTHPVRFPGGRSGRPVINIRLGPNEAVHVPDFRDRAQEANVDLQFWVARDNEG